MQCWKISSHKTRKTQLSLEPGRGDKYIIAIFSKAGTAIIDQEYTGYRSDEFLLYKSSYKNCLLWCDLFTAYVYKNNTIRSYSFLLVICLFMTLYRPYLLTSLGISEAAPMYNAFMKERGRRTTPVPAYSHTTVRHAEL